MCLSLVFQSLLARAEAPDLLLSFEQRLAAAYGLATYDQDKETQEQILARMNEYIKKQILLPRKTVKIKNFKEFIRTMRGDWPGTHSLALDLQIIEARGPRPLMIYQADTKRVQAQIDKYLQYQAQALFDLAFKNNAQLNQYKKSGSNLLQQLVDSEQMRMAVGQWAIGEVNSIVSEKLLEIGDVGKRVAQNHLAQQSDPSMRIFMQTMFEEYFTRLSTSSKMLMISDFLGGNLNLNESGRMELLIQNAGPQMQKLLQVIARQGELPLELRRIFQKLESAVKSAPWIQVKQIVESEKQNYVFKSFERKPLGVGTMAQVHRAKLEVNGETRDVVVRFLKPGISDRVEEDHRILMDVAQILDSNSEFRALGLPKVTPLIEDITKTVRAELNLDETIRRQMKAKRVYESDRFISTPEYKNELKTHVPLVIKPKRDSVLMVQETVHGTNLEKALKPYADLAPEIKKALAIEIADLWAKEVLFGSGFYHSDLHQGNFLVNITDRQIVVNILDYGMGGTISEVMQRKVMLLGVGAELNNDDYIFRAFWKLSDRTKNQIDERSLKLLIRHKVADLGKQTMSMDHWTAYMMDNGLVLPYDFISLNRGIVILNSLLKESGSEANMTDIVKSLGRRNPLKVYRNLVSEENVRHRDLMKLGWMEISEFFSPDGSFHLPDLKPSPAVPSCRAVLLR